jgi:peroxiredoxin
MGAVAEVGQPAPTFALPDLEGQLHALEAVRGRLLVLVFWSAECPWSGRGDDAIAELGLDKADDVAVWRLASNVNESLSQLRAAADERGVAPVLLDVDHGVADRYGALTTPHIYVIDGAGILRYAGAPSDATWRQPEPNRHYLAEAVDALRQGELPEVSQTPGRGCTIMRFQLGSGLNEPREA